MATNRVIKTDGDLDITATDTSVSGTLTVSGQATISGLAYPTSDGSADQVLVTNGSGTLSFADAASGGGVDTVATSTEASNYSGTNRIIYITASTDVIFTSALSDRIIINETANKTSFYANLTNCSVSTKGNIEIRNTSTDGSTDIDILNCKLMCDTLTVNNSGNTSGNQTSLSESNIHARNITFSTQATSSGYFFSHCNVFASDTLTMPPSGGGNLNIWFSNVNVNEITGFTNLNTSFPSTIDVREGAGSSTQIQIGGTDYLSSAYSHPFTVNKAGIKSNVSAMTDTNTAQSVLHNTPTKIIYEDVTLDNTSSYNSSTGVFTAQVKGIYLVNASLFFAPTAEFDVGEYPYIKLVKNTTTVAIGRLQESDLSTNNSIYYTSDLSFTVQLDVNDTLEIQAYQNSNATLNTHNNTTTNFFHINKIN